MPDIHVDHEEPSAALSSWPAAPTAAEADVARLQADGRLLGVFLAAQSDRPLAPCVAEAGVPWDAEAARLLYGPATDVAAKPTDIAALMRLVEALGRRAAPANVNTIRMTGAYVGWNADGYAASVAGEARALKRVVCWVAGLGLLVLAVAVSLLVHTANGRGIVQQVELLRADHGNAQREVLAANTALAAGNPSIALRDCLPPPAAAAADGTLRYAPRDSACARLRDVEFRMSLVYTRLARWNAVTAALAAPTPLGLLGLVGRPALAVPQGAWDATELRAAGSLTALTGFVLPMLLGFVGACAFVYRQIDRKIDDWTLEARDRWKAVLRVLLGVTLGALVGALFTKGESLTLQGFELSLAAVAFFVGYAVQVVFVTLDGVIEAMSRWIRGLFQTVAATPPRSA